LANVAVKVTHENAQKAGFPNARELGFGFDQLPFISGQYAFALGGGFLSQEYVGKTRAALQRAELSREFGDVVLMIAYQQGSDLVDDQLEGFVKPSKPQTRTGTGATAIA
jgi:hypothetical protein